MAAEADQERIGGVAHATLREVREWLLEPVVAAIIDIKRKVDQMSQALEGLEGKVAGLETEDEALVAAVGEVVTEVGTLETEIAALHNTTGDVTEAELAEKVAPIAARIEAVSTKLGDAVTSIQGALPKPPAPPAPTAAPQSVYAFHGTGEVDTTEWPLAPFKTGGEQAGRQLYFSAKDTPGADPYTTAGVGAEGWELFTGEVVAS